MDIYIYIFFVFCVVRVEKRKRNIFERACFAIKIWVSMANVTFDILVCTSSGCSSRATVPELMTGREMVRRLRNDAVITDEANQ